MSKEIGRVQGEHHRITVSTSVSAHPVELAFWDTETERTGFGDGLGLHETHELVKILTKAADASSPPDNRPRPREPFSDVDTALRLNVDEVPDRIRRQGVGVAVDQTMVDGVAVPTVWLVTPNDLRALTETETRRLLDRLNEAVSYLRTSR